MRNTINIAEKARLIDMTYTSLCRMDVELGDSIIRGVVIGPSGEAILPFGTSLPLGKMIELEFIAQTKYLALLVDMFGAQRQRRVGAE